MLILIHKSPPLRDPHPAAQPLGLRISQGSVTHPDPSSPPHPPSSIPCFVFVLRRNKKCTTTAQMRFALCIGMLFNHRSAETGHSPLTFDVKTKF